MRASPVCRHLLFAFRYCSGTQLLRRLTCPSRSLSLSPVQVLPPRLLPHPDAVGVGAARRGAGGDGAVAGRVVRHRLGVGQVSGTPEQAWANYGPGAMWGPLRFLIRPANLEVVMLIVSIRSHWFKYLNVNAEQQFATQTPIEGLFVFLVWLNFLLNTPSICSSSGTLCQILEPNVAAPVKKFAQPHMTVFLFPLFSAAAYLRCATAATSDRTSPSTTASLRSTPPGRTRRESH